MNINELYERLKDKNKDLIDLLENELSTLDKNKIYDFQFEKRIKKIIKTYNNSLKITYETDVNFSERKKVLTLIITISNKNTKIEISKNTNEEDKTKYSFLKTKEFEKFDITEKSLNFTHAVKDKRSLLDDLVISIKVNKDSKFLLDSMRNEWEDYFGGSTFNEKQTLIYSKIKEITKNYDIDFLKLLFNDKEEISNLKEYIELEKLMDDSTVLEEFFIKTNVIGKLNLNDFKINKNEGLIQTLIKTKNKFFSKS